MARPEAKIDMAELEKLCGMQCTDEEVAAFFGVSTRTIERWRKVEKFRDIMDQGRAKGRVSVRRSLFKLANAGNIAAAICLSKNLLGYKDVLNTGHTGLAGGAIQFATNRIFLNSPMKNSNSFAPLLTRPFLRTKLTRLWLRAASENSSARLGRLSSRQRLLSPGGISRQSSSTWNP